MFRLIQGNRNWQVNITPRSRKDKSVMEGHEKFYVIEGGLSCDKDNPTHLLFIKNNKVCFQNRFSLKWGSIIGKQLCSNCVLFPCNRDECAFILADKHRKRVDIKKLIKNIIYHVTAIPMHNNDGDFFLVAAKQSSKGV